MKLICRNTHKEHSEKKTFEGNRLNFVRYAGQTIRNRPGEM